MRSMIIGLVLTLLLAVPALAQTTPQPQLTLSPTVSICNTQEKFEQAMEIIKAKPFSSSEGVVFVMKPEVGPVPMSVTVVLYVGQKDTGFSYGLAFSVPNENDEKIYCLMSSGGNFHPIFNKE